MSEKVQSEVDAILASLESDEETPTPEEEPLTRLLDIHVFDVPTESITTDAGARIPPVAPSSVLPVPQSWRWVPWLVGVGVFVLTAGLLGVLVIIPLFTPSVSLTIIPVTKTVTTMTTVTLGRTIPGRVLASITMQQAQTVPATGTGHQDATNAHGLVTLYNAAPYAQTVPAGTLLTDSEGVEIVTDQDATIPAGTLATNGQITLPAHAVTPGPSGNIAAGAVTGNCCRVDVLVTNSAFTGGNAARDYQAVTPGDIQGAETTLTASLTHSMQAAAQAQVQADESLLTPLACQGTGSSDVQPGAAASQVDVTVSETCTPVAYQTSGLQALVTRLNRQAEQRQDGPGYVLAGEIQTSVLPGSSAPENAGTVTFGVKSTGMWAYQFSATTLHTLASRIAGKSKQQATRLLLHTRGVSQVETGNTGTPLPSNPDHIHLLVLYPLTTTAVSEQ